MYSLNEDLSTAMNGHPIKINVCIGNQNMINKFDFSWFSSIPFIWYVLNVYHLISEWLIWIKNVSLPSMTIVSGSQRQAACLNTWSGEQSEYTQDWMSATYSRKDDLPTAMYGQPRITPRFYFWFPKGKENYLLIWWKLMAVPRNNCHNNDYFHQVHVIQK